MTTYLDCNATTPVAPEVAEELLRYTVEEFGNAGSRTHEFGARAKRRVREAREQVAAVVDAEPAEVLFTSGATEANNIALLGLQRFAERSGRRHIISTQIEHKAVLEPLEVLADRGFEVELVPPSAGGYVRTEDVISRLRPDTVLVSVMHVNNETGAMQPIEEIAKGLRSHNAFFHTDAAQGFGKDLGPLSGNRIDLISVSAHKLYGPKGVGALVARRRQGQRLPLEPLLFGGGQERGLRPGTVPVGLVAALGTASVLALSEAEPRRVRNAELRRGALAFVEQLGGRVNSELDHTLPTTLNVSFPGVDAEAAMVALKGTAAVSNGSACTSQSYTPSHVLEAMGLPPERIGGAVRISWSHLTTGVDWDAVRDAVGRFVVSSAR